MYLRVCAEDFDLSEELARLEMGPHIGASVSFIGHVRDTDGTLDHMLIEHYPGMCEQAISKIMSEAKTRFALSDLSVVHRYGSLKPGEQIMMVATCAPHRKAAFEGADFLMDYLKSRAPFWKKESYTDGRTDWVDAKSEDEDALSRW